MWTAGATSTQANPVHSILAKRGAGLRSGAKTRCLTLEKRAFHTFVKNTSWQIQANDTGHICVSMVVSTETASVIYGKHSKVGCIYRNAPETCSYF